MSELSESVRLLSEWLEVREANCNRIAERKPDSEKEGWMDDAWHFKTIRACLALLNTFGLVYYCEACGVDFRLHWHEYGDRIIEGVSPTHCPKCGAEETVREEKGHSVGCLQGEFCQVCDVESGALPEKARKAPR